MDEDLDADIVSIFDEDFPEDDIPDDGFLTAFDYDDDDST